MNGSALIPISAEMAQREIADLTRAYCRYIDRADETALKNIFHDDSIVLCGVFNGAGQRFATEICRIVRAVFNQTLHSITDQHIEVDGETATAKTHIVAISTLWDGDGQSEIMSGGRYLDRFERRGGIWKFAEHKVISDWSRIDRITGPLSRRLDPFLHYGLDDPVDFRLH